MRELIEELKQTNQLFSSERDLLEDKLKAKAAQLHKFASQCQLSTLKVSMLEKLVTEHKLALSELQPNSSRSRTPAQVQDSLRMKESELQAKLSEEQGRITINLKLDPTFVALKDELINQVKLKERLLDQ